MIAQSYSLKKGKLLIRPLFFVLLLLCGLFSCQSGEDAESVSSFRENYLAHSFLAGDSSAVIVTLLADSLNVPWEIAWGPDGRIWYTEQKGRLSRLNPETGEIQALLQVPDLVYQKSRGLFSFVFHPGFEKEPYVYLCYTHYQPDTSTNLKVVRYTYKDDSLENPVIILENIPGATYHNGSRLLFTADQKLLITTGDAGNMENSQDPESLSGKVLRLNPDGSIPEDNPFSGNPVWTWGHRNPQGLAQAGNGYIYISDHGADNDDEVNLIRKGRNYGWPDVMGFCDLPSEKAYCSDSVIAEPLIAWSPVIAPAGLDYYNHAGIPEWKNSLLLGSLKNQTFRVLKLNISGDSVQKEEEFFPEVFGRIRDVCISPEGDVYLSTSNRDWHPPGFPALYDSFPRSGDDKIIKISRADKEQLTWLHTLPAPVKRSADKISRGTELAEGLPPGEPLYRQYCSGCHGMGGMGVKDLYPPLAQSEWVNEDKDRLIKVLLEGLYGPIEVKGKMYNQQMPAYRFLSDKQLSEILSYIRQNFGNKSEPVSPEEIAKIRDGL